MIATIRLSLIDDRRTNIAGPTVIARSGFSYPMLVDVLDILIK